MSVDHKGMAPGLMPQPKPQKTVDIKCRVDGCDSTQATEIVAEHNPNGMEGAPSRRMYQCVKCHTTWGLPVGGAFMY